MITLAPNVYVLRYLTDTGKLDATTRTRAENNMKVWRVGLEPYQDLFYALVQPIEPLVAA